MTSISVGYGAQLVAHAQGRLAADQAARCAPCQIKEDEKAIEAAQGIATAEANNGAAQGRGTSGGQGDGRGADPQAGRLLDITV